MTEDSFVRKEAGQPAGTFRVSAVIPVYNGKEYLKECLRSLEEQDFGKVEVIIVDDCSSDGSAGIIAEYAAKSRHEVRTISNQANRGQGESRNIGISAATGEYVLFIDQDDVIAPDYIRSLLESADGEQTDIVMSGYWRLGAGNRRYGKVELIEEPWSRYMCIAPWGKLYRLLFLRENDIRFASLALGEDVYFNINAMAKTDRIATTGYCGYYWRTNPRSFSNTAHRKLDRQVSMTALFDALLGIDDRNTGILSSPMFVYFLLKTLVYDILHTAPGVSYPAERENEASLHGWMKAHYPGYLRNPYLRIGSPRGELTITAMIVRLYVCMYRMKLTPVLFRLVCHGL